MCLADLRLIFVFRVIRFAITFIKQSLAFILNTWTLLPTSIFADSLKVNKYSFTVNLSQFFPNLVFNRTLVCEAFIYK